jgi:hypothetical protein
MPDSRGTLPETSGGEMTDEQIQEVFEKVLPGVEVEIDYRRVVTADLGNGVNLTLPLSSYPQEFVIWTKDNGHLRHKPDRHWPSGESLEDDLGHFTRCLRDLVGVLKAFNLDG